MLKSARASHIHSVAFQCDNAIFLSALCSSLESVASGKCELHASDSVETHSSSTNPNFCRNTMHKSQIPLSLRDTRICGSSWRSILSKILCDTIKLSSPFTLLSCIRHITLLLNDEETSILIHLVPEQFCLRRKDTLTIHVHAFGLI